MTLPGDPNLPPGCTIADCDGPVEQEPDWDNMNLDACLAWLDEHDVDVDETLLNMCKKIWEARA